MLLLLLRPLPVTLHGARYLLCILQSSERPERYIIEAVARARICIFSCFFPVFFFAYGAWPIESRTTSSVFVRFSAHQQVEETGAGLFALSQPAKGRDHNDGSFRVHLERRDTLRPRRLSN